MEVKTYLHNGENSRMSRKNLFCEVPSTRADLNCEIILCDVTAINNCSDCFGAIEKVLIKVPRERKKSALP